jgi:hypothetical protein
VGSLCAFFLGIALGFGGVFAVALALYAVAVVGYLPLARGAASTRGAMAS